METNSRPRWLISIARTPDPCQSSISAAACCNASSGRAAGPAEKLNGRGWVIAGPAGLLLLRGRGGGCRGGRARRDAELLGHVLLQRLEARLQHRAHLDGQLLAH